MGEAASESVTCCERVRKGAMRGLSARSHSFQRAGQPLKCTKTRSPATRTTVASSHCSIVSSTSTHWPAAK